MGDSECSGSGCDDGRNENTSSLLILLSPTWVGIAGCTLFAFILRNRQLGERLSISKVILMVCVALIWPLLLCGWMLYSCYLAILRCKHNEDRAMAAARSRQLIRHWQQHPLSGASLERELERARSYNPYSRNWAERGWLIMMRARHQRPLLGRTQGWVVKLRRLAVQAIPEWFSYETRPARMGIDDMARSKKNFKWAVAKMVDMDEEVLFHQIMAYV
ncbi:unnamed protein product [Ectocarpus sp. 4 AP-2014]